MQRKFNLNYFGYRSNSSQVLEMERKTSGKESGKTDVLSFRMPTSCSVQVAKNLQFSDCSKLFSVSYKVPETFTNSPVNDTKKTEFPTWKRYILMTKSLNCGWL